MVNPVLKRLLVRVIVIFALTGIIAGAWILDLLGVISLPGIATSRAPLGSIVVWVPVFAGQAYLIFNLRKIRRQLRQANGLLCARCSYDLHNCEPSGACPECGTPYDPASLQRAWKDMEWKQ